MLSAQVEHHLKLGEVVLEDDGGDSRDACRVATGGRGTSC